MSAVLVGGARCAMASVQSVYEGLGVVHKDNNCPVCDSLEVTL